MRPRAVDWLLLSLVGMGVASGLATFLVGRWPGRSLFALHGILGLAIALPFLWKLRRVLRRLVRPILWDRTTLFSLLATVAVLVTVATGVVWSGWQWPTGYPNGMILHTTCGLLLLTFTLVHLVGRYRPLRGRDLRGRRAALRFLTVIGVGGLSWGGQQVMNRVWHTSGAQRRFTGSRLAQSQPGELFPITMWMFDRVSVLDPAVWTLQVDGSVAHVLSLSYSQIQLAAVGSLEATLDCTGGWYTSQTWQGVPLSWLLDLAQPMPTAMAVSFVSATGYRWSLPLAEARQTLLATHVGGQVLDAGHGAPLRLVAPGRRGFQWVKRVTQVRVLDAYDYGQWTAIFTSGLGPGQA